ncbi:MAG: hypothetical protein HY975_00445 [Candidatus Kerfeldbacteria bacterium]|nr:hypothetical protein [Candidatus Kerfeldbacteria bacterium]
MADTTTNIPTPETTREQRAQNFWGALKDFRREITVAGGLGLIGWLLFHVTRDEDGRNLLRELKEGVVSLAGDLGLDQTFIAEQLDRYRRGVHALRRSTQVIGATLFALSYTLAIMSTTIHDGAIRAQWMLPVGMLLTVVSVWFATKWVIPAAGIMAAEWLIPGEHRGATFGEKFIRLLAKTNGWYMFGLNIIIICSFWHRPQLLWFGLGLNFNYVYFCNGWRRGENENARRTILWLTAMAQGVLILLTPYPKAVDWLQIMSISAKDPHFYVPAVIFSALLTIAMLLGTRKTQEDKGREAVKSLRAAAEELSNVSDEDLSRVERANAILVRMGQMAVPTSPALVHPDNRQFTPLARRREPNPYLRQAVIISIVIAASVFIAWGQHHDWWTNAWTTNTATFGTTR